jgi:hypothetical protein
MPRISKHIFLTIISYFLPLLILAGIWFPVIRHYFVADVVISENMVDTARSTPSDNLLDQIILLDQIVYLRMQNKEPGKNQLIDNAESILKGKIKLKGFQSKNITMPFSADDIDSGLPSWQLALASFKIPDILLTAYEATRREEFLVMAKEVIIAWASYERRTWFPKGYLWNDHAVAARIPVIIKFWRHYRNHADFNPRVAKDILQMVARSGRLLAKPSHFRFATNHGIIQNLALLEIYLAFSFLPDSVAHKRQAIERLTEQIDFIVNDKGVVLEHSAGYQRLVLALMGKMLSYLKLMNLQIPLEWIAKYKNGIDFYAQIARPDGSLPVYGDTRSTKDYYLYLLDLLHPKQTKLVEFNNERFIKRPFSLYLVAGYSVWWNGLQELPYQNNSTSYQTLVAWSYFPGRAHKHADEMSVLVWAKGRNWWTNTGFWAYGTTERVQAVSWAGSNAPHLISESTWSIRHTRLVSYVWSDKFAAIELERTGPEGYVARRQVIKPYSNLWIVLDNTIGAEDQKTTTTWTTSSHINLSIGEFPGSYKLEAEDTHLKLTKFILTSNGTKINNYRGSLSPFAGWDNDKPAPAIVIEQPAKNSWAAVVWLLQQSKKESHSFEDVPSMLYWKSSDNWHIDLPLSSNQIQVQREDNYIFVHKDIKGHSIQKKIQLANPRQIPNERAENLAAYDIAAKKYSRKFININRHRKATYLLFAIYILQVAVFYIYSKIRWKNYPLKILSCIGWAVFGVWLFGFII